MAPLFNKPKYVTLPPEASRRDIPAGLWSKCPNCGEVIHRKSLEENLQVCPKCDYHNRMTCQQRLALLLDEGSFQELDATMISADPLQFEAASKYAEKLLSDRKKTGLNEAVVCGLGRILDHATALAVMDFRFRGASMGSVVGEKITRITETATAKRLPLLIVAASGGARMEEGMLSLMQMAKTSGALARHAAAGLSYIALLTHPTTGGVTASFASLGDVIVAEPGAYIGFAGARVIKQTIKADLPEGFQSAEFLLDKGLIDRIVHRRNLRQELGLLLDYLGGTKH